MANFYLGTNLPSASPGQAAWVNTGTLGAKYNVWDIVFPNFGFSIPGSDLALQAFSYTLTIPAGVVALGDTVNWRFAIYIDGGDPLGGASQFKWGLRFGGSSYLTPIVLGVGPGSTANIFAPNGLDGVIKSIGNPVDMYLSGTVLVAGAFTFPEIQIPNPNIAGPIAVEILWEWQAGADPTATAGLYSLGFEVVGEVP